MSTDNAGNSRLGCMAILILLKKLFFQTIAYSNIILWHRLIKIHIKFDEFHDEYKFHKMNQKI